MSLIEGIGDEVTHFFIGLFVAIIVYIAWSSTSIAEYRNYRTVLLLDRRRRASRSILRVRLPRQLSNHTETVTISEGSSSVSTAVPTEEHAESSDVNTNTAEPTQIIPKPGERSTSSNNSDATVEENFITENQQEIPQEIDERHIIETMDDDSQNVLRLRRLVHFEGSANISENQLYSSSNVNDVGSENNLAENIENSGNNETESRISKSKTSDPKSNQNENQANITIKLKYINDDIKVVDGQLEEHLGDFKRRHFHEELNSNKIIRLIFNGQVLKQDRQTLKSCGLFDNCVVHCLIHQKRTTPSQEQNIQENSAVANSEFFRGHPFVGIANLNNNNQGIDWDLGNFLFAAISFILLAAWYFRYVYAHLYTVTATVGLIIITGIFSIVLVGMYFPDNEQLMNTRIRIARAERIEVQQQS